MFLLISWLEKRAFTNVISSIKIYKYLPICVCKFFFIYKKTLISKVKNILNYVINKKNVMFTI